MRRVIALAATLVLVPAVARADDLATGRIGPALSTTGNGRVLTPAGRMTTLGNFPSGGALSPDGRSYWAIDSGLGHNDVTIVDVASGQVRQTLPLPGAYGAVAFAPDGRTAYVSGEPKGDVPAAGPTKGDTGDVVHVFAIAGDGHATETDPIALPRPQQGLAWPIGLAVTPDAKRLVVALNQTNQLAIVDLATRQARVVGIGALPTAVAITPDGRTALVTCEYSGVLDVVDLDSGALREQIGMGGARGNTASHPAAVVADPHRPLAYVAVASRDTVQVVDLARLAVARTIDLGRPAGLGVQPVGLALSPDGRTLYAADSGEDAVAVIRLAAKGRPDAITGRVPTAAYPTTVAATRRNLVWLAAKGLGSGPNIGYAQFSFNAAKYGTYTPVSLIGRLGVLPVPAGRRLQRLTRATERAVLPANAAAGPPPGSPVVGPGGVGSPSDKIKHVFYVVRENRVYDQIFGSDPRGDGDPKLELFDDNGAPGPAGGVTPNAHALARLFPLLDHFYANSEVSIDGHIITAASWAIDYVQRTLHANYGNRGRAGDTDKAVAIPPNASLFDEAARRAVSFRNYGESTGGAGTAQDDGRATYKAVRDNTETAYPFIDTDAGATLPGGLVAGATPGGHLDVFRALFEQQLATNTVPALSYITLPIDHTLGTTPGIPTPRAFVADNDLALGQLVDLISHSSIWSSSAIFVVEDDAQDGADHLDAHRMPAFVISPWARRHAVVHTRYDQESVLRTIELILGLRPLSLFDGTATPMYDAFDATPDVEGTRYDAIPPSQSLKQLNLPSAPDAKLSAALPFDTLDLVPEAVMDRVLWHSVYGQDATPPPPGPNASPAEAARAAGAMRAYRAGRSVRGWLRAHADTDELQGFNVR